MILCSLVNASEAGVGLPYENDFENSDGVGIGLVSELLNWSKTEGLSVSATDDAASGVQALELSYGGDFGLEILPYPELDTVGWVDFYLKPSVINQDEFPSWIPPYKSAVTGFGEMEGQGEVYAIDGDGFGSGKWLPSGASFDIESKQAKEWMRLTYRLDFARKSWDLFVDGQFIYAGLGFLDDTVSSLGSFTLRSGIEDSTNFDFFYAGFENPIYLDSSNDGLPDAWLEAQGLSVSESQRYSDLDFDGLDAAAEYINQTFVHNPDSDGDGVSDGMEVSYNNDPSVADSYILGVLPFSEDFESYFEGSFFDTENWIVTGGANVSSKSHSGSLALDVEPISSVKSWIAGSSYGIVWVDVWIENQSELQPSVSLDQSVVYSFDLENRLRVRASNNQWTQADVSSRVGWRRYTVKNDYSLQSSDIYVDGLRVLREIPFSAPSPFLNQVEFLGPIAIDEYSVLGTKPVGLDDDADGLDNESEILQGTDPELFDSDNDGMGDLSEIVHGFDPLAANSEFSSFQASSENPFWVSQFSVLEGFQAGDLAGQMNWLSSGAASVSTEEMLEITDSIEGLVQVSHGFGIEEIKRVWVAFDAEMIPGSLPETPDSAFAFAMAMRSVDSVSIWNAQENMWKNYYSDHLREGMNTYAFHLDFIEKASSVYANGVLLADNIPFLNSQLEAFSRLMIRQEPAADRDPGEPSEMALFDNFYVSAAEPADMDFDGDGLVNEIERQEGTDLYSVDSDGDGLDDLWEYQNGLDASDPEDVYSDSDGDFIPAIYEMKYGLDPNFKDSHPISGIVMMDQWWGAKSKISSLTAKSTFPLSPDRRLVNDSLNLDGIASNLILGTSLRVRGYLSPLETGDHEFWIKGENQAQLWLSDDDSPFEMRNVAQIMTQKYRAEGYDVYAEQKSQPIYLEAGKHYYFEVLQSSTSSEGNFSVSWKYGAGPRAEIPSSALSSAGPFAEEDSNDNGLKDSWESNYPAISLDGYWSDSDADGLLDILEYQIGTSPVLFDSDGDGFSDYVEYTYLMSDPSTGDVILDADNHVVIIPSNYISSSADWLPSGDEVYSTNSTGSLGYELNLLSDGVYYLEIEIAEQSNVKTTSSEFEVRASLNGVSYGIDKSRVPAGDVGKLEFYLPYLSLGAYTLDLDWINGFSGSQIRIKAIHLYRLTGEDDDASGVADWVESRALTFSSAPIDATVYTSPFPVEGESFSPELVAVSSFVESAPGIITAAETKLALSGEYFAEVLLSPEEPTVVNVIDGIASVSSQLQLTWAVFNVFENASIDVRLNDSLLLGLFDPEKSEQSNYELTLFAPDGSSEMYSIFGSNNLQVLFDQPGDWVITGTIDQGEGVDPLVFTSNIRVMEADLSPTPIIVDNVQRDWQPNVSAPDIELSSDAGVMLYEPDIGSMPRSFRLSSGVNRGRILARLPNEGPIISSTGTTVIRDYTRTQTHDTIVETFEDGTVMVSAYIILNEVPEDLSLEITIFKSGVTFDDGTITRTVTAEDFDESGRYRFYMLRSPSVKGGNCHRYFYFQDDTQISTW
ncbi:MAG: PA14 domain-containing protein [Opitutales bacterium]